MSATILLVAGSLAGAATADAGVPPEKTGFTVVTSFSPDPSPIIEADGPWADCTGVLDLSGYANQIGPRTVRFSGEKQVICDSGDVIIQYDADLTFASKRGRTSGTWVVLSSTHPGIEGGAGTVKGDPAGCDDCIVDVFTGRVY